MSSTMVADKNLLHKFALFAILLWVFLPTDSFAQIGFTIDYPANYVAEFSPVKKYPSYIGIGARGGEYIPAELLDITRTLEFDSLSSRYIVRENFLGQQYRFPLIIEASQVDSLTMRSALAQMWHESTLRSVGGTAAGSEGAGGINFSVPMPIQSKAFNRLVGGSGELGLRVNGDVNIQGNLVKRDQSIIQNANEGSSYSFKLEQNQRFNIVGSIGDKIDISIDQDSQRDFEIENSLKLTYTGYEDEIFKSIEAGNVALSLPGTQFISLGGSHQGLFGFKTVSQFGDLNITTVASLERGQKNSITLTGGAKATPVIIKDYQYLKGTYFFIDSVYEAKYRISSDGQPFAVLNEEIENFELWISGNNYDQIPEAIEAWASADRNFVLADTVRGRSQGLMRRFFQRVDKNTYSIDVSTGLLVLDRPVDRQVLAVAYRSESGTYGDIIPPTGRPFKLKLLRTDNPLPSDPTWDLEWKNVYSLGRRGIAREGFEVNIVNNKSNTRDQVQGDGSTFLEALGLDRSTEGGASVPDSKIDVDNVYILNFQRGHLILPGKRPFDPKPEPPNQAPNELAVELRVPEIYDSLFTDQTKYNAVSQFDIEVTVSEGGQSFPLGFQIIEGSEEVYLDGRLLQQGVDYDMEYAIGRITVLNREALTPGAKLQVNYESAEIFQLDKKTLLGTRVEYPLGERSFIGATALYLNERILENRVTVGQEPLQNIVWGTNGRFAFDSYFLTRALNSLPGINATAPSGIQFEGEFAQSIPNPNTMDNSLGEQGVAYIDDFEGIKRVNFVGIAYKTWTRSSIPKYAVPTTGDTILTADNRAKMIWYNPIEEEKPDIADIFPNRETNTRTGNNKGQVMVLSLIEGKTRPFPTENAWGGIMKWMTPGNFNQTDSKFLEIWVQGEKGTIGIDFGLISEDAYPNEEGQYGTLNTEDKGAFKNGLDEGEDIGLDGIDAIDGPDSGEPEDDDWDYAPQSTNYDNINGTDGNSRKDRTDGIRKPDTEDIDGDGTLDEREDYFRYIIKLGATAESEKYIAGGRDNPKGWRLYRIPLNEFSEKFGNPDFSRIEYTRLWITDLEQREKITIHTIDLVGNSWKELGVAMNDQDFVNGTFLPTDSTVLVDVVNTEDNQGVYNPPPGVQGLLDKVNNVRAKEQSLQIRINNLKPGESGAIQKTLIKELDIINYGTLKMFVNGDNTSDMEFFMQLGRDSRNYYEIRKPLVAGWEGNEIEIDLQELTTIKDTSLYPDSTIDVENGEVWRVKGLPTLRGLLSITVGVKNTNDVAPIQNARVWIDELRVTDVDRTKGSAVRANINVGLSDIGSITASILKRNADFRSLSEQFGTGDNNDTYNINANLDLERVLPIKGFNVPFNFVTNNSVSTPKYVQGSDVLFGTGGIATVPLDSLPPDTTGADTTAQAPAVGSQEIIVKTTTIGGRIARSGRSDNWWMQKTIDALSADLKYTTKDQKDITRVLDEATTTAGNVDYRLSFQPKSIEPFKFLGQSRFIRNVSSIKLFLTPQTVNAGIAVTETSTKQQKAKGRLIESNNLNANRTVNSSMNLMDNLSLSITRQSDHNLNDFSKAQIFQGLFNDTTAISSNQTFTGKYTPKILTFLSPDFTYNTSYNLKNNIQNKGAGKTASLDRKMSSTINFSLRRMINLVYKSDDLAATGTGTRRPAPRRRVPPGGAQQPPPEQTPQPVQQDSSSGPLLRNPLYYLEYFSSKLAPISVTFNKDNNMQNGGLETNPSLAYQFGFVSSSGASRLDSIIIKDQETKRNSVNVSSRLSLNDRSSVNLKYTVGKTERASTDKTTGDEQQTMFIFGDTRLPMPDYSVSISGLQQLFFFDKLANSVTFNHDYTGTKSIRWQETPDNAIETAFDWSFNPIARVAINWKRGASTNFSYGKTNSLKINVSGAESKTETTIMTLGTTFNWNRGFRIPLPFLRNKRIQNTVSYEFALSNNLTETFGKKSADAEFNPTQSNSEFSLRNTFNYSFTSKVTGSLRVEWRKTNTLQTGENTNLDVGVNVRIRISG